MGFAHGETHAPQIAVLILQLKDHPGSPVLNQLKPTAGIGLFPLILHTLLREAKIRCKAENVTVIATRIEDYQPPENFDTLASRAVSTVADLISMTGHLHHPSLRLITMKGIYPEEELSALTPRQREMTEVFPVAVPGLDAHRHIVVVTDVLEKQS